MNWKEYKKQKPKNKLKKGDLVSYLYCGGFGWTKAKDIKVVKIEKVEFQGNVWPHVWLENGHQFPMGELLNEHTTIKKK